MSGSATLFVPTRLRHPELAEPSRRQKRVKHFPAFRRIDATEWRQHRGQTVFRKATFVIAVLALGAIGAGAAGGAAPSGTEGGTGPTPFATLEPAPPGLEPRVSEQEALTIAMREEGRSDATSVSAALAVSRVEANGATDETLVWIVRYEGVCIIAHGPPGQQPGEPRCAASTWDVVLDATTGEFLVAGTG